MNQNNQFSFFVPSELVKGKNKDGVEEMRIRGYASSDDSDSDGEELDNSGFDIEPFMKTGFFNYDHKAKETSAAIVGEPTLAEVRKGRLYVEGVLYPDSEEAQKIYKLGKTLEKHSKTRRLGFSIEGQVVERGCGPEFFDKEKTLPNPDYSVDKWNKIKKARITGIAITPCPKNPNTLMQIMKSQTSTPVMEQEYDEDIVKAMDETIEKGGEGSKGGKVVGHTTSGKPIYGPALNHEHVKAIFEKVKRGSKQEIGEDRKEGEADVHDVRHHYLLQHPEHDHKNIDHAISDSLKSSGYERTDTTTWAATHRYKQKGEEVKKAMEVDQDLTPHDVLKDKKCKCKNEDIVDGKCVACGAVVGQMVKKSEVYNLIADHYTTDIEKAKQIYSLIQNIDTKLFNMKAGNEVSQEAINKAFAFLNGETLEKSEVADAIVKSEATEDKKEETEEEKLEKAKTMCKSLPQDLTKGQMIDELIKGGYSLALAATACATYLSDANANKDGGKVTEVTASVVKSEEAVVLDDQATKVETIEKSIVAEELVTVEDPNTALIKGLGDNINAKFSSLGKVLQHSLKENDFLKGQISTILDNSAKLEARLSKFENKAVPSKSATKVAVVEKFEKSEAAEDLNQGTDAPYDLSKSQDCAQLSDRLYAEAILAKDAGNERTFSMLEKAIGDLEVAKSIPESAYGFLKAKNIRVIRSAK